MAYEAEEIRTSQEIFYYLLEHHERGKKMNCFYIRHMQKKKQSGIW